MSESSQKPIVAIIDSNYDRCKGMQDAFAEIAQVQYGLDQGGNKYFRAKSSGDELEEFVPSLLTLRHIGDALFDADAETILTIYYSGNGGNDERYRSMNLQGVKKIWRAIGSNLAVLTKSEARQLLQFARNSQTVEPDFLNPPKTISIISAIVVLCQGYLAVQAADFLNNGNETDAERLIEKLHRDNSDEQAQKALKALLTPKIAAKLSQVNSLQFWRKPFLQLTNAGETDNEFKKELFLDLLNEERKNLQINDEDFNKIKEITSLFETSQEQTATTLTLPKIENAYNVLEQALKKREGR